MLQSYLVKQVEIKSNRNIPKGIDYSILDMILTTLFESGSCEKFTMSAKLNLNHDNFRLYVEFLDRFSLIKEKKNKHGDNVISLTVNGMQFCKMNLNIIDFFNMFSIPERKKIIQNHE